MPRLMFSADGQSCRVGFSRGEGAGPRRVDVKVGGTYVIKPENPQRTRNVGRTCRVTGFKELGGSGVPGKGHLVAAVQYLDNNRHGSADICELVPAGAA